MNHIIESTKEKGYVSTMFERRRTIPEINSSNFMVRSSGERMARNTPIQGSAADIIKTAMVSVYREIRKRNLKSRLILQVHDELNFSVLPEERETVQNLVLEEMQRAFTMSVPLVADYGWGNNWLEAH